MGWADGKRSGTPLEPHKEEQGGRLERGTHKFLLGPCTFMVRARPSKMYIRPATTQFCWAACPRSYITSDKKVPYY